MKIDLVTIINIKGNLIEITTLRIEIEIIAIIVKYF